MLARRLRSRRRRGGFTLLEVLLVVAILVILGSVSVLAIVRLQKSAYEDVARTQMRAYKDALTLYYTHVGRFPSANDGLQALRVPPGDLPNPQKWRGPYVSEDVQPDPWQTPYQYEIAGDEVRITSAGPDGQFGTDDDIRV